MIEKGKVNACRFNRLVDGMQSSDGDTETSRRQLKRQNCRIVKEQTIDDKEILEGEMKMRYRDILDRHNSIAMDPKLLLDKVYLIVYY